MTWINNDSYKLIGTEAATQFTEKNNLNSNGESFVANFFNGKVLIRIYEERKYLHADYYDLINNRWARELQSEIVTEQIPSLEKRKMLIASFNSDKDVLEGALMQRFYFIIHAIDAYMQDFINGELEKYDDILSGMEKRQESRIEDFKRKFLKRY